jgi:hypothetical protein
MLTWSWNVCTSLILNQEQAFFSLLLKYKKKYLELAYESPIAGALMSLINELAIFVRFRPCLIHGAKV